MGVVTGRLLISFALLLSSSGLVFADTADELDFGSLAGLFKDTPFAVYGNHCGPNHGDPTYKKEPKDELDALCKRHDECYDVNRGGYYQDCSCDYQFIQAIKEIHSSLPDETRQASVLMQSFFKTSGCSCKKRTRSGRIKRKKVERTTLEDKGKCL
eukprot:EC120923.1.p1 GENE.EC120923.1~~EC120923.1.p1  ORF type:complete len:156 (+),score=7.69 EC120923.1:97-564(+)